VSSLNNPYLLFYLNKYGKATPIFKQAGNDFSLFLIKFFSFLTLKKIFICLRKIFTDIPKKKLYQKQKIITPAPLQNVLNILAGVLTLPAHQQPIYYGTH
jgi:hypothetical protein